MEYLNRDNAIGVGALNLYIRDLMAADPILTDVRVRGEISNFKRHSSGHLYFSLKDEDGVLRSVMFRGNASRLKFVPADGMRVLARGSIEVYPPTGQYQLYVTTMEADGVGELYRAYEALKGRLASEGLFDSDRKKPLPAYPRSIGIVTAPGGAAIQDMLNILGRRYPLAQVTLYPALVQGSDAPQTLIRGIRYFRKHAPDVIIIGRGGGSIEDLWCFNDEGLAREIAACEVPVISAVGHETDFTICDFVSDLRAPTPSAAAELAVPDIQDLKETIQAFSRRAESSLYNRLDLAKTRLGSASQRGVLQDPVRLLHFHTMKASLAEDKVRSLLDRDRIRFRTILSELAEKLYVLNPLSVLARGFAWVADPQGKSPDRAGDLSVGDTVSVRLHQGSFDATVQKIYEENTHVTNDV